MIMTQAQVIFKPDFKLLLSFGCSGFRGVYALPVDPADIGTAISASLRTDVNHRR